jgi:hypothetical protein
MQEEKITLDMLYAFLKDFKSSTDQRFVQADKRADQLEKKFDDYKHDINQKIDDFKQDTNNRFSEINQKFDDHKQDMNNRFDRLENNMSADKEKLDEVYENHKKRIFGLNKLAVALNACLAFVVSYFVSRHGA